MIDLFLSRALPHSSPVLIFPKNLPSISQGIFYPNRLFSSILPIVSSDLLFHIFTQIPHFLLLSRFSLPNIYFRYMVCQSITSPIRHPLPTWKRQFFLPFRVTCRQPWTRILFSIPSPMIPWQVRHRRPPLVAVRRSRTLLTRERTRARLRKL